MRRGNQVRAARRERSERRGEDKGFTLVELLVSMSIFAILMALIFSLFITMLNQATDNLARTRSVEQARLGIAQIDRQVRSGNVISDPASNDPADSGVPSNYSLRVYTQEGGDDKCAQWRVIFDAPTDKFGRLEFREWKAGDPSTSTEWYSVASNVQRPTNSVFAMDDPTTYPPFWVDPGAKSRAQNVHITLRMGDPKSDPDAKPASVTSVVTGRNTVFGYSPDFCKDIPPL